MLSSILILFLGISSVLGQQVKTFNQKKTRSEYAKYLRGHVFKTTTGNLDPQHCLADCWAEQERCESFNFLVDQGICELNDRTKENAPLDFIDRDGIVYLTNPAFGKAWKPTLPRNNMQYPMKPDACASNPCQNGGSCVLHDRSGFLCVNCTTGFYGPFCEYEDFCTASPCLNGARCVSQPANYTCQCVFPTSGANCELVNWRYQFNLDGNGDIPTLRPPVPLYRPFAFWFWFKTTQNLAYFVSFVPDDPQMDDVFSVWKNGSTFFLELKRNNVFSFSFPYSYPLDDNTWHSVCITTGTQGSLFLYVDGATRAPAINLASQHTLIIPSGVLRLGFYKDSHGRGHYYKGSISHVDIDEQIYYHNHVRQRINRYCLTTKSKWAGQIWTGFHLAAPLDPCETRVPNNGVIGKYFQNHENPRWMEQTVSPPVDLDEFTVYFIVLARFFPDNHPYQIACYGPNGDQCSLSVTIQINFTLTIVLLSTTVQVDLIPIFDGRVHHVAITWTHFGGILEVVIDTVLQSKFKNIEPGSTIPGQNRFLLGGSDVARKNFVGHLDEFNVWDKVLTPDELHFMARKPGDDKGNVVCWKGFYKPVESFGIVDSVENFHMITASNFKTRLDFASSGAGNYAMTSSCCTPLKQITFITWISWKRLPGVLMSYESAISPQEVWLRIDGQGGLTWSLGNSSISIGSLPVFPNCWHFIGITWHQNGNLDVNLDGEYSHVSSQYRVGYQIHGDSGTWYIGSKTESFEGSVSQANIWSMALPQSSVRAMSRGVNNLLGTSPTAWHNFRINIFGEVHSVNLIKVYSPAYQVQLERDDYCSDVMASGCNHYYARLAKEPGVCMKMGCFCEKDLAQDMNFNFSRGDYSHSGALFDLT